MDDSWPTFMTRDPLSALYYNPDTVQLFADFTLVCQDEAGSVVGKAHSISLFLLQEEDLPADG
nr:hypothetical protein [Rhodococcus sp. 15-1154-1]